MACTRPNKRCPDGRSEAPHLAVEHPQPSRGVEGRETSVLELVAAGHTNRQVAAALFTSEKTVSVHLSRVTAKLVASSRTEAVSVACARGLLAPADREMARADP